MFYLHHLPTVSTNKVTLATLMNPRLRAVMFKADWTFRNLVSDTSSIGLVITDSA